MPELLIGELVRQRMSALSASERRLARVLLASYPVAGLESLPRFAERAEVSPATVTRFIAKLGVHGYPEFQEALRRELQARLSSPIARFGRERSEPSGDSVLRDAFEAFEHSLHATLDTVADHEFEAVADLLSDTGRRVLVLGGRVSAPFARYLSGQLHLLRPGVPARRAGAEHPGRAAGRPRPARRPGGFRLPPLPERHHPGRPAGLLERLRCGADHRPVALPGGGLGALRPGHQRCHDGPVRFHGGRRGPGGGTGGSGARPPGRRSPIADAAAGSIPRGRGLGREDRRAGRG